MRSGSSAIDSPNASGARSSCSVRRASAQVLIAATLFTGSLLCAQSASPPSQQANINQALAQLNTQINAATSGGASWSMQTKTMVAARRDLIVKILRDDPSNARTYALDPAVRTALLAADATASSLIEQERAITGELVGSVADDFEHNTSSTRYRLHTFASDTDLSFSASIPHLERLLHHQVTVRGVGLPEIMAADSLADATPAEIEQLAYASYLAGSPLPSAGSPAPAACSTTGTQNIAVLLVTFPNNTPSFPTGLDQASYWNQVLFGPNPSVNGFWNEVSYGQTSAAGNIFGPFALPQAYDCTTTSGMQAAAIAAASGTVDFTQYNRIVIAFPATSCWFGGYADIGCEGASSAINHQYSNVWLPILNNYTTSYPQMWGGASHELGHNLGLNHANTLDFGSITLGPLDFTASNPGTISGAPPAEDPAAASAGPPAPLTAVNYEYADAFSVMGYPWNNGGPYSAEHRADVLGWIPLTDERDVTASGPYTLVPAENSSGLRVLHVLRDPVSDSWLWLEFHQPIGFYTPNNLAMATQSVITLTSGALIHYETGSLDALHTYQLDMKPVALSNNFENGTLAPGSSWSDPYSLLTLTAGTQTSSSLPITVSYDTPCAALSLSSSVLAAAAGTANLNITAPATCSWNVSSNASWISFPGTISGSGNATIPFTYTANTAAAQRNSYITAQRQSLSLVQEGTAITITGVTPNAGSSANDVPVSFTLNLNDAVGASDIQSVTLNFAGMGGANCEMQASFSGSSTYLYLYSAGSQSLVAGGPGTLSTPFCTLSAPGSSYVATGNSGTLTMVLSFSSAFVGAHNISATANSKAGSNTGTLPLGYWIVGPGSTQPTVSSLTISPSTVFSGGSASLTLALSAPAPVPGATVSLASSSSAFPVPGFVTIPFGQTSSTFSNQSGSVSSSTLVTLTANYNSSSQQATVTVNPLIVPTITFTVPNHTYSDAPFTVSATSNSPGAITYSVVAGPATISGATVTLTGAGTVVLQASQAASGNYAAATKQAGFGVAGVAPTITFAVPNHTYGDAPFTVSATSNSPGAISYIVLSGAATISGSTVTLTGVGVGTVILEAFQAASGNYLAGAQTASFTVAAEAPTITFSVPSHTYGDAPFPVLVTSNSSGAITYSVVSGPASISGSTVTLTGAGTVVLQASQAAAGNYAAGTQTATFTVAGNGPTITFTVSNHTYGDAPFAVSASSNSSGAITYSVISGPATISGSTVTLTGVGTVVLQASQVAAGNYVAGTQTTTFTVAGTAPTITFAIPNHTYGDAPFAVSATSNSPGAISYSVVSGPATISGSTVTLTGIGAVFLQASQAASGNYAAATKLAGFSVAAIAPTITFAVPNHAYGDAPFTVSATSNSSGAFTYSVAGGPAAVSGSTVTLTGTGTVILQVSQLAAGNYLAGTQTASFTVVGNGPTITFAVSNHTYGDPPFSVSATSNSSGAITYSVVSGPATISGSTVTLTGVGTVVLQVSQAAAGNYVAGAQTATFMVAGIAPTITFTVPNHTYGNAPFALSATSNSSGTITYSVVSGPATIAGITVTLTGAGTVVLQASQAASGNYSAGSQTVTFAVAPAAPTISFSVPNHTYGDAPFAVSGTSNSSGAFTYSVISGPATMSGPAVTLTGAGTVVLQANQVAAGNYSSGSQNATFTVSSAVPTIAFSVPNHTYGDAPFAVSATSNSSGAVTYSVVSGPATIAGATVTLTGAGTVVLQVSQVAAGNYAVGTQTTTFTVAGSAPVITFTIANHTYGDAPFAVSATSNSSGAVTYSIVSGPAMISGSTVTLTGAGTVVLQASQGAAGNYAAGIQTATFTVAGTAPTITFTVPNHTYGDGPFTVAAISNSSGAFTYSVVSGPATISGAAVTLTGAGTVVLQVSQTAAGNYTAGTQTTSFTVAGTAPSITFSVANHTYGDVPFIVSATSNSSGAFTYSVVSGPATLSGPTVTITGAGAVVLQASQAAAGSYSSEVQNASFTVAMAAPTISFSVPSHIYGDASFAVSATSNSSGAITYSVVSGPATLLGSTVTLTGAGTVTLQANQAATGNYAAGTLTTTFTVAGKSQTIAFAAPTSPVSFGVPPVTLSASATSGLPVTFSLLSGPASLSGSTLTITGAGTVVVAADQSGNTNYAAATEVTHSITVNKIVPVAGLTASPNPALAQSIVTLTATVSSMVSTPTGSVVFSDGATTLGTASLSGGNATLNISTLVAGTHSITAGYGGDANFSSVSSAAVSETVQDFTLTTGGGGASQTIQPGGTASFTLPLSPSGGTTFPATVTFSATGLPSGFTATFTPSSLPAGSSATNITLMIQVPTTAMLDRSGQLGRILPVIALALLVPFLGGFSRTKIQPARLTLIALLLISVGAVALTGCGGGGSGGGGTTAQPRTYNATVTATAGTLAHSTTVTVIVQ